jgi:hypothetical protein
LLPESLITFALSSRFGALADRLGPRVGIGVASGLVIIGGLIGAAGIRDPRRAVRASQCPGGQLAGASLDAAGLHPSQAVSQASRA